MNNIMSTILDLIKSLKIAEEKLAKKKAKEISPKENYFYCGQVSPWKRNCKACLESRKEAACDVPSTSGIYVIKINTVSLDIIWVYDTSCGSYKWIVMQGLIRNNRKLTKREFDL